MSVNSGLDYWTALSVLSSSVSICDWQLPCMDLCPCCADIHVLVTSTVHVHACTFTVKRDVFNVVTKQRTYNVCVFFTHAITNSLICEVMCVVE